MDYLPVKFSLSLPLLALLGLGFQDAAKAVPIVLDALTESVMVGQDDITSTIAPTAPGDGWYSGAHAGTIRARTTGNQEELRTQWNFRFDASALAGIDPGDITSATLSIPQIGRLNTLSGPGDRLNLYANTYDWNDDGSADYPTWNRGRPDKGGDGFTVAADFGGADDYGLVQDTSNTNVEGTFVVDTATYAGLLTAVQNWATDPADNEGFLMTYENAHLVGLAFGTPTLEITVEIDTGAPVLDQSLGVSDHTTDSATVNATLVSSTAGPATVTFFWGLDDGLTDPLDWDQEVDLGTPTGPQPENLAVPLAGLSPLTRYYYRFRADNSGGETWADATRSFITLSDQPAVRPNLLVIYADDMGFSDMAAYGSVFGTTSSIPTPNMDALASQGMMFTQAHSSSGVCTPSRYGILTGRYSWRLAGDGVLPSGIVGLYGSPIIRQGELTISQFLRNQGYTTAAFGKWHLGAQFYDRSGNPFTGNSTSISSASEIDLHRVEDHAVHRGFDHFFGTVETINRPPYAYMRDDKVLFNGGVPAPGTHPWSWLTSLASESPNGVGDPNIPQIDYSPDMIDEAVAWLNGRAAEPEPFFAYVSLYSPHAPHLPTPAFQGSVGFTYGDFVHETDHWIGRVIDAIDDNPTLANTIVVITSDNGPETHAYTASRSNGHDANGPFRGVKRDSWEGGTRVPFVVRWPGQVAAGTVTNELVWQGDIFSTIAAVLGVDLGSNDSPDGESFLNVIRGQAKPAARRDSIVIASIDNQLSVKTIDGWKLIDGTGGGGNSTSYDSSNTNISSAHGTIGGSPKQLFHLPTDLGEDSDVEATQTAKRDELLARLAVYRSTPTSNVPPPDNDLDGMPNPFENTHGFDFEDPADGPLDADFDTLSNADEALYDSNPHKPDSDDDELGDATEVNTLGTLPGSAHSDSDSLTDGEEVLHYSTDPLLADTDGDGLDDDDELAAASNPRNADSHPVIQPPVTTTLAPSIVQLAGLNGTVDNPQALGDTDWPEAGTLHVRERTAGNSEEWRTRLFLAFDLSGITGVYQDASLRLHQVHRLNTLYSAPLEAARVLAPWASSAGSYPTFFGTAVAGNFLFGNNGDFGMAVDASGFYSGSPGTPGTGDSGFDPGGSISTIVDGWLNGAMPNHGLRIAFQTQALVGAAFSTADDPATATLDESPALLVTTVATSDLDGDNDHLPDSWELDHFPDTFTANATTDSDLDGAPDLLELALGSDPTSGASRPSVTIAPPASDPTALELTFLRSREAALGYSLEQSADLSAWSQAFGKGLPLAPSAVLDLGNGYEEVRYELTPPLPDSLFLRIGVITP